MKKISVIFILYLVTNSVIETLAEPSPVLLFLSRQDQSDTLGYNLVSELPVIVYREIMSGRVPLWDSPEMEIQIMPASLKRLEESSRDEFIHAKQLFVYELWDLDKRKGDLATMGFFFSNRTSRGEEVSYGFVEYEKLDSVFRNTFIPSNANGNCDRTFYEVLKNKYYFFNVVQIGERKITSIKESLSLKDEVKQIISKRTTPPEHDCKDIYYMVEPGKDMNNESMRLSAELIRNLEVFLNGNMEVYYNLGGDRVTNFILAQKISVTSAEVHERWHKRESDIGNEFKSIKIFVENKELDIVSSEQMSLLDLVVNFSSLEDFLMEKEFYFRITKINNQEVLKDQSAAYIKGLRNWRWNQITDFVRYE